MSFNFPTPSPPQIPADTLFKTSRINSLYPDETIGPYTSWKLPVIAATTVNIVLQGIQVIDGITLVVGDRILVKNQTNGTENGIYVVNTQKWYRADDLNKGNAAKVCVFVNKGTTNNNTAFLCSNQGTSVIGVDILTFIPVAGSLYGLVTPPAGLNTQIQYNNSGVFGASSLLTFNPTATKLVEGYKTITGILTVASDNLTSGSPTVLNAIVQPLYITGGTPYGIADGGDLIILGGPHSDPTTKSGNVEIASQINADRTGIVSIYSGDTNIGISGNIRIYTGNSELKSGDIEILCGTSNTVNGGSINLISGVSTLLNGGNINLTASTGGTLNGSIYLKTNNTDLKITNGGIQTVKDILNSPAFSPVTTTLRQGIITVPDPSTLGANSSVTLLVNNVNILANDSVYVSINGFTNIGNGIPMAIVSNVAIGASFEILIFNLAAVPMTTDPLVLSFIIL